MTRPAAIHANAFELLNQYRGLSLANANEAETRLKLIDRVLFEVLGWEHDDVQVEERVTEDGTSTYSDYIFRTGNTAFVVEAKRVGATFSIASTQRRLRLRGSTMEGPAGEAIVQARDYCRAKGIQFAAVTNGHQWIVFPANRVDQVSFADSSAILFNSLETILGEELEDFCDLLSREAVVNGHLEIELLGRNEDQIEQRRLNSFFPATTRSRNPNPIYPLIQEAIVQAFTDSIVDKDADLLAKCYVQSADRTKFDNRVQMHLRRRESLFQSQAKKPMRKRDARALPDALDRAMTASRPLAILVLGPVGAGKTTFLHHTRKVSAADFFEPRKDSLYPQWIEVDFRQFTQADSPAAFVYRQMRDHMASDDLLSDFGRAIRPAYAQQIEALRRGPMHLIAQDEGKFNEKITELITSDYARIETYVDVIIRWCASHVPVFLVIDNLDQFERIEDQSKIFADCIAIATRLGTNLIVSMREATYVRHRHTATFDAFDFDPIQIEPPRIEPVLSKRFFLARSLLKGQPGEFRARNGALFKVADLSDFIDLVQSSVLGTSVGARVEVLAAGNVRLALRMTREFLASGYTDPAKALQIRANGGTYTLPRHEALRSIMLGNQPVYSEEYSVVGNPFDSRVSKTNAQPLRLFVLSALVKLAGSREFTQIDGPAIRDTLAKIGFAEEHTLRVLEDLCRFNFVHTSSHGAADFTSAYIPTRLGGHIVRELISDMTFVENVLMDTFVADHAVWNELRQLSSDIVSQRDTTLRLRLRIKRVKKFYDYMIAIYAVLQEAAQRRGLPAEWCGSPLVEGRQQLWDHCSTALRSSRANYPVGRDSSDGDDGLE